MPQVILKEQLIQPATLFLQEILINIKTRHFHSSINHQEHLFHRTLITSYFRAVNIAKFLRAAFLQSTSRSSRFQMFLKIGAQNSFANFTGKHLCWSFFLKNLQAEGLQIYLKKTPTQVFSVKFAKFLRTPLFTDTSGDCFYTSSVFFLKNVIKQIFRNFVMTY